MGIMGGETDCMIGFHAISVLGEAIVKDLGGFDYEKAYQLCKKTYEAGRDQFLPMKNTVMFPVTKPDARVFPKR